MTKLRHLHIERFRDVPPGTALHFSDKLNVLLGLNGSGKTTLLRLIGMLVRSDLSALAKEEFSLDFTIAFDEGTVRAKIKNTARSGSDRQRGRSQLDESAEVWIDLRPESGAPAASVYGRVDETRILRIGSASSPAELVPAGGLDDYQPTSPDFVPAVLLAAQAYCERQEFNGVRDDYSRVFRLDESLLLYDRLFKKGAESCVWIDIHRRDSDGLMLAAQDLSAGPAPLCPAELAKAVLRRCQESNSLPEDIRLTSDQLPFLDAFVTLLGLSQASLRMERHSKVGAAAGERARYQEPALTLTGRDGTSFTEERLSYGQKRLLTFLYYLAANPSVVVADELVNGLHHQWIEECMRRLGERQCFLTSQNPLLLDYLWFESAEHVRSTFILCQSNTEVTSRQISWANLSPSESAMFYDAYCNGVQHVSEILRTRGLW